MKNLMLEKIENLQTLLCNLPFENKEFYSNYLAQTYYFVDHSVRLLGLAMARSENLAFRKRCIEHIAEEKGHEVLCINDLKFLGLKPSDFKEHTLTKAFYQTQYYKIDRKPISILGYILALEILAAKVLPQISSRVKLVYPNSMSFIKVHAEEDQDHIESAFAVLEMLTDEELKIVMENFETSLDIFVMMINSISQEISSGITFNVMSTPQLSL